VAPSAFLHPFARPAADADDFITIVRGEGAAVWDAQGRRYVDGLASLWYCAVGHGRAELVDAAHAQMQSLAAYNTFDIFTNEPAEQFSALVAERAPVPGARVFLTSSGSEAVDTAIKLSRLTFSLQGHSDRHLVVGRRNAYHGVTYGGLSAQGLPLNQEHFGPMVGNVERVASHDLGEIEALFAERGQEIAAVLAEPVQGAGGVYPPAPGYLERLRELCDEYGALLVFDEVITAFGRLGSWFGAEHYGVTPDLITFAKGCTSGYLPLGGVVVGRAVLDVLEADPAFILRHGFTYSGHPTACAVGVANIGVLEADGLLDRAPHLRQHFAEALGGLADEGLIAEARGAGAVWAAGMRADVSALDVRAALLRRGVIARPIGAAAVAFCPPLVIDDADLRLCTDALREALVEVIG
jgi:adenosylmethionine-8-amino-7-oxononanoate aminotransferase